MGIQQRDLEVDMRFLETLLRFHSTNLDRDNDYMANFPTHFEHMPLSPSNVEFLRKNNETCNPENICNKNRRLKNTFLTLISKWRKIA